MGAAVGFFFLDLCEDTGNLRLEEFFKFLLGFFIKVMFFAESLGQVNRCVTLIDNNSLCLITAQVYIHKEKWGVLLVLWVLVLQSWRGTFSLLVVILIIMFLVDFVGDMLDFFLFMSTFIRSDYSWALPLLQVSLMSGFPAGSTHNAFVVGVLSLVFNDACLHEHFDSFLFISGFAESFNLFLDRFVLGDISLWFLVPRR